MLSQCPQSRPYSTARASQRKHGLEAKARRIINNVGLRGDPCIPGVARVQQLHLRDQRIELAIVLTRAIPSNEPLSRRTAELAKAIHAAETSSTCPALESEKEARCRLMAKKNCILHESWNMSAWSKELHSARVMEDDRSEVKDESNAQRRLDNQVRENRENAQRAEAQRYQHRRLRYSHSEPRAQRKRHPRTAKHRVKQSSAC